MITLDKDWLRGLGIEADTPEELQDLLAKVDERIHRQIYILVPGELTKTQLAAYDEMWNSHKDVKLEAEWLEKNLSNYAEFAERVQQAIGNDIKAAKYKKLLVSNWSKPPEASKQTKSVKAPKPVKLQIDQAWLRAQGVKVKDREVESDLLNIAYDELEIRVGLILANGMTDDQLDEFEASNAEGDDAAIKWLETNFPDYKKVVKQEYAALSKEVKEAKNKITVIKNWAKMRA